MEAAARQNVELRLDKTVTLNSGSTLTQRLDIKVPECGLGGNAEVTYMACFLRRGECKRCEGEMFYLTTMSRGVKSQERKMEAKTMRTRLYSDLSTLRGMMF
ncbi:hypothetical protein Y032_0014g2280 [Ancylostoma ceylanicum]|uniref:Uncharacterized protein n=1 Tax=Ancylostoma ceylanicum TaxID=53326 RepID=A0A016V8T6_9BILA|nr:hypothetical protein Y032_0014g2280 [Ancylostoma ceylanicum]